MTIISSMPKSESLYLCLGGGGDDLDPNCCLLFRFDEHICKFPHGQAARPQPFRSTMRPHRPLGVPNWDSRCHRSLVRPPAFSLDQISYGPPFTRIKPGDYRSRLTSAIELILKASSKSLSSGTSKLVEAMALTLGKTVTKNYTNPSKLFPEPSAHFDSSFYLMPAFVPAVRGFGASGVSFLLSEVDEFVCVARAV
ncbi:hypothetical protein B9Z19DRAFT_1105123 [Tuber borchii]|uniref:Uncharacterized protein n=1 Tax=Tuber borchii TaxID=42251 RepID=A0A2T7A6Z4_TUBBO|nr:hypothetical protein B9Z19DRAFT_1105123 [Tuber borchii]